MVATDSEEVLEAARASDVEARMTRADHPSGTDRVFEAARAIQAETPERPFDVIVNVQGDEPDIDPGDLARLVAVFEDPAVSVATLWGPIRTEEEARDSSIVKLVCDTAGDALYFSRAPIPSRGHARAGAKDSGDARAALRRHIGVYAFRPAALQRFCALPVGALEASENLEQLRWLEAGGRMRAVEATHVPHGIDTHEDYEDFVRRQPSVEANRGQD